MEKIGLLATEFSPNLQLLVKNLEEISNATLRIGYCRSLAAIAAKQSGRNHPDLRWALENGIAHPDREQELLRNCDLLMVSAGAGSDLPTLPLMSSRTTFLIPEINVTGDTIRYWAALARQYGTSFDCCLPGSLAGADRSRLIKLAEAICRFFLTGQTLTDSPDSINP